MTLLLCFFGVFGIGMVLGKKVDDGDDLGAGVIVIAVLVGVGRLFTLWLQ